VVGATVLVIPPAVFGAGTHFAEVLAADCLPPIIPSLGWGPFGIAPELVPAQAEPTLADPVAPTFSSVTGFLGVPGSIVFLFLFLLAFIIDSHELRKKGRSTRAEIRDAWVRR